MLSGHLLATGQVPENFYTSRGITGQVPTDYKEHGGGVAALSPDAKLGYDYYIDNYPTLQNYLHGTYFKQGKAVPGTNISNIGQLNTALFGSPYDKDFKPFSREAFDNIVSPNVANAARDWEVRDISRGNQSGFEFGGLAGAALTSAILAPAVAAGSGIKLGALAKNPVSTVKNALTKGLTKANPNAVPGMATGVTTPTGGGLVGSGALNPAAVGLQGGAPLGANALAAAGTAGVTPLAGVPDLTSYFNKTIPGTNQYLGKHVGTSDLLKSGLKKVGSELLKKGVNTLAEGFLAPDAQTNVLAPSSVAGGSVSALPALSGGDTGDPILDRYQYALADQLTGRQDKPTMLPQYQTQKLEPGNPMRIPGYQKKPFANALAV